MILSDFDLRSYISSGRLYIDPFDPSIVRENGLDLRLGKGSVSWLRHPRF
jgi:dCTP deaminase (EC 3.5.4.13)